MLFSNAISVLSMDAAIISYKTLPFTKEVKKIIHLVLHTIALALGIVGVIAAFKYHNESNIANLYSLHSWIGIGVISLYGVQVIPIFGSSLTRNKLITSVIVNFKAFIRNLFL